MSDAEALGRVLAVRRTVRGWKRKDLAARAGISYPYLSELETGGKEPSLDVLRELARALGTTASSLLASTEELVLTGDLSFG